MFGAMEGWEFIPLRSKAFFIRKGSEIHCWRSPDCRGRWITRRDIEDVTAGPLAEFGHVTTTVRIENKEGRAFVERLGFRETHRDRRMAYYTAERMNHARL